MVGQAYEELGLGGAMTSGAVEHRQHRDSGRTLLLWCRIITDKVEQRRGSSEVKGVQRL
jgi:hypothetical protein